MQKKGKERKKKTNKQKKGLVIWKSIESSQESCEIQVFMEGTRYEVGGKSEKHQ